MANCKNKMDMELAKKICDASLFLYLQNINRMHECITAEDVYNTITYILTMPFPNITVSKLCDIFRVSRSGYYYHRSHMNSAFITKNMSIADDIRLYEAEGDYGIGYLSVTLHLRGLKKEYANISVARVKRIMDRFEIISDDLRANKNKVINKVINGGKAINPGPAKPNLLNREYSTQHVPNKFWTVDITEIKTGEGTLFLCVFLDLCGRYIMGYSCGKKGSSLKPDLVRKALSCSLKKAKALTGEDVHPTYIHSDRGQEFRGARVQRLYRQYGIESSMSRPHTPQDNACIESFFSNLKNQYLNRYEIGSFTEAKRRIKRYIDFYNNIRLHQSLMMTPAEYWKRSLDGESLPDMKQYAKTEHSTR